MTTEVVFAPEAEAQLVSLYNYIAVRASPSVAQRFIDAIVMRCESLVEMPLAGRSRDDIRRGLRTLSFRRRIVIAYRVEPVQVTVLAVFYGGQDFEALLRED